jgi:hypothetical protein
LQGSGGVAGLRELLGKLSRTACGHTAARLMVRLAQDRVDLTGAQNVAWQPLAEAVDRHSARRVFVVDLRVHEVLERNGQCAHGLQAAALRVSSGFRLLISVGPGGTRSMGWIPDAAKKTAALRRRAAITAQPNVRSVLGAPTVDEERPTREWFPWSTG